MFLLYENAIKVSQLRHPSRLDDFVKWIHKIKHPGEVEDYEGFRGAYTIAGCENDPDHPIIINPLEINGLVRIYSKD